MVTRSVLRTQTREELERLAQGDDLTADAEAAAAGNATESVYCVETGAAVPKREAVREKLRLYPLAQTNEIVASFARDGITVSAALVRRVRDELWLLRGTLGSAADLR